MRIKEEIFSHSMMDSACTRHLTIDRYSFCSFSSGLDSVHVGNGATIQILFSGSAMAETMLDAVRHTITFHNVLYVPDLMYNLISIPVARRKALQITINDDNNYPKSGRLELYHKMSGNVKLLGIEIKEGL